METAWSNLDREHGFFSSDERRWINRIHKLKEKYPDEVTVIAEPEDNGGCIYAKLPCEWMRIGPISRRQYTDEEKAAMAQTLANWRLKQASEACTETDNDE